MEEITCIVGDSGDIFEFSSKQISQLDNNWDGTWVISKTLGGEPILTGNLTKNNDIKKNDSLVDEDFRKTYKIFEPNSKEKVEFNDDKISGNYCIVSGMIYTEGTDNEGLPIKIPEVDKYITITIKGVFVSYSRSQRVKTDAEGNFTYEFNIGETIDTPADSFFIFQLMPFESELLEVGTYILSVEVKEKDINNKIIFRREVLQAKLKMTTQGVLS